MTTVIATTILIVVVVLIIVFWKWVQRPFQVLTVFLRYLWLLFPSFLFLLVSAVCFWKLLQGRDLLIASLEGKWGASVILWAVVFWVITTWYSSRMLVYKRDSLFKTGREFFNFTEPDGVFNQIYFRCSEWIGFNLPRLLGYMGFAIVIIGYLQLPIHASPLKGKGSLLLLTGFIVAYLLLSWLIAKWARRLVHQQRKKLLITIYWLSFALLVLVTIKPLFFPPADVGYGESINFEAYRRNARLLVLLLIILQQLYLFLVVTRRMVIEDETVIKKGIGGDDSVTFLWGLIRISESEKMFFIVFNIISAVAVILYFMGVFSIKWAVLFGSLNFAILAFGILVGFFQLVSLLSIKNRINFHIIFLLLVIIFGYGREPHYARLVAKSEKNKSKVRPDLKTYFSSWIQLHRDSIAAKKEYPIFFVLADGGASRSGYWVASVLGMLHDSTRGKFDEHLFALSGASGGSVGNGAYFSLLANKYKGGSYATAGQDFLKHDFLSFTLARMLGPDFFRPLLPIDLRQMNDRAGALEQVMEMGANDTTFLQHKFAQSFYSFVPDSNNKLPILCINTTRMQDGRPGVISNFQLDDATNTFGKRLDVLNLLAKDTDIRLSTAIVMGARFPYVSPAGRIDKLGNDSIANYFVDGGYFDNSGAGVVHEMIIGLYELIRRWNVGDSVGKGLVNKLSFYVIHITNSPSGSPRLEKVHPIKNDLLAPITTLAGAYGAQTDVNDSRLKKYLQLTYAPDNSHYQVAELYNHISQDTLNFPMNWTISSFFQSKMQNQLRDPKIGQLVQWVRGKVE